MSHDNEKPPLDDQIALNLRRAYQQRVEEKVPDRFTDLLKMLAEQEKVGGSQDANK